MNVKDIHIGKHIKKVVEIRGLPVSKACLMFKLSQSQILDMYASKTLDSGILLQWCKLLDYNFFMIYNSHLQLYKPLAASTRLPKQKMNDSDEKYVFRKNLYSPYVINWLLDKIDKKQLTPSDIITKYNIPRTTLYRWIKRNNNKSNE